ncbi:putative reverse transcriptase domain-containing protein [Tanacetum coccineum]
MSITIHSGLKTKILEAQSEASKDLKALAKWLRGLERHFELRDDGEIYFFDRIWIPSVGDVKKLIMDEAHTSRYSVHPGADKMYYDLRDLYWWPGMKRDIAEYVSRCLTCSKIKAEHQKPSGFLQQLEIPELTKSAHFLPIREDYKTKKLTKIYVNEIVSGTWICALLVSIFSDMMVDSLHAYDCSSGKALGTRIECVKAYHPRRRSDVERTIQTLEDMLRACIMDFGGSWDTHLPLIELSYNNSYHTTIKCAPFEALYGRKLVRFGKKGKLAPRYVGPFEIVERVGPVPLDEIEIDENLRFIEEPIEIVERDVKRRKEEGSRRRFKVRWNYSARVSIPGNISQFGEIFRIFLRP